MKYSLTLYYSVQNGGDGSAYPRFMSSQELADFDQENMDEGWGESCTGSIDFESDSPIIVKENIETPESYLIKLINNDEDIEEFVARFFPDGKPKFTVTTRDAGSKGYLYNDVFVDGVKVAEIFKSTKASGKKFEDLLNS